MNKVTDRDGLSNAMWGLLGMAAGFICTVIEKTHDAFFASPPIPLTLVSEVEISLFAASFASGICINWLTNT